MKTAEELKRERDRFYAMFIALNFTEHKHLTKDGVAEIPLYDNDPTWEDDNNFGLLLPPPGEEGAFHSHDAEGMYDKVLAGLLGHKN
ncbi:hypothetical protein AAF712_015004, partial [Marasmius tenuissimus]